MLTKHTCLTMEGKLTWIIGLWSFHSPDWVFPWRCVYTLYSWASLHLPPTSSSPRGARLKHKEISYKWLCKGHIFNSIPTFPITWGDGEDRVDFLLWFLQLCSFVHSCCFKPPNSLSTSRARQLCLQHKAGVILVALHGFPSGKIFRACEDERGGRSCNGL